MSNYHVALAAKKLKNLPTVFVAIVVKHSFKSLVLICFLLLLIIIINKKNKHDFYVLFLRKAHSTERPSRGCPHLVLILQLSRLKQCR